MPGPRVLVIAALVCASAMGDLSLDVGAMGGDLRALLEALAIAGRGVTVRGALAEPSVVQSTSSTAGSRLNSLQAVTELRTR